MQPQTIHNTALSRSNAPAQQIQPRLLDPFNQYGDTKNIQNAKIQSERKEALQLAAGNMRKYLDQTNPDKYSWLIQTIAQICSYEEQTLQAIGFIFENSIQAAEWNSKVLKSYQYDYEKAVSAQPFSMVTPGSEFRDIQHIQMIWKYRENWIKLHDIITQGVTYPLQDCPSEQVRMSDLKACVSRGNHKSALKRENAKALTKAIEKEVKACFLIPIKLTIFLKSKELV